MPYFVPTFCNDSEIYETDGLGSWQSSGHEASWESSTWKTKRKWEDGFMGAGRDTDFGNRR